MQLLYDSKKLKHMALKSISTKAVNSPNSQKDSVTGLSMNIDGVGRLYSDKTYTIGGWMVEGELSSKYYVVTRMQVTQDGRETRRVVYEGNFKYTKGVMSSANVSRVIFFRVGESGQDFDMVGRIATPEKSKIINIRNDASWSSLDSSSRDVTYFASSNGRVHDGAIEAFRAYGNGSFFPDNWWQDPFVPNIV